MFKFNIIPKQNLPQKQTHNSSSQEEKSLDEKFLDARKKIWRTEHRNLREFHFLAIEHEGFLIIMNGYKKIFAKLENPQSIQARREARLVYVEAIRGREETEGGCYFDYI